MTAPRTLLCIAALLVELAPATLARSDDPASLKRSAAARLLGVAEESLIAGDVRTRELRALGVTVTEVKGVDRTTGQTLRRAFDGHQAPVDLDALLAADHALAAADPTWKLDVNLRQRLTAASPAERVPVAVWLRLDTAALDRFAAQRIGRLDLKHATDDELRAAEGDVTAHVIARTAQVVAPFLDVVAAMGLPVRYISETAPIVFVDATAEEVERLAERAEVDSLLGESPPAYEQNADANATHRTGAVKSKGVKGNGIRVAVLEAGMPDITCPDLAVAGYFFPSGLMTNHATAVAGCIASTQPGREGAAPDVDLYAANAFSYSDADVVQASDWVANLDIDVTNLSFGDCTNTINFKDHFFNYESRALRDSYASGAGNTGSCASAFVGTPSKAYNVLSTGNLRDFEDGDWANDDLSPISCWVNPTSGCEKPNFAANGTTVDTLGLGSPWQSTVTGNSISGPHMVGNLANAMQVDNTLRTYPEAAMALMMATAWHNVEGANALSTQDGAGGIVGHAAYRAATDGRVEAGFFDASDFNANDQTVFNIHLQGGKRARVCFAWSAYVGGSIPPLVYFTLLGADFDMTIFQGADQTSGVALASSSSLSNNYEIVEFTPPSTGTYSVRIDGTGIMIGEPFGLAWSQECDIDAFSLVEAYSDVLIDGLFPSATKGATLLLDVVNPAAAGQPYAVVPSSTKGNGTLLQSGKWLPVELDAWSFAWLALLTNPGTLWKDSVGVLDSDGINTAPTAVRFPCAPVLVGLDFHHAPLVLDTGAVDFVKEVGEVYSYEVLPEGFSNSFPETHFAVQLPFAFPFYGNTYPSCFVHRNGTVTFGQPDPDPTESASELFSGPPRIAGLWDKHSFSGPAGPLGPPRVEVQVLDKGDDKQAVLTFLGAVDQDAGVPSNASRIVLHEDGEVELHFGLGATRDGLVGISPGMGAAAVSEIDLDASGHHRVPAGEAAFEWFAGDGEDDFDLGARTHTNGRSYWTKLRFVPHPSGGYELRAVLPLE